MARGRQLSTRFSHSILLSSYRWFTAPCNISCCSLSCVTSCLEPSIAGQCLIDTAEFYVRITLRYASHTHTSGACLFRRTHCACVCSQQRLVIAGFGDGQKMFESYALLSLSTYVYPFTCYISIEQLLRRCWTLPTRCLWFNAVLLKYLHLMATRPVFCINRLVVVCPFDWWWWHHHISIVYPAAAIGWCTATELHFTANNWCLNSSSNLRVTEWTDWVTLEIDTVARFPPLLTMLCRQPLTHRPRISDHV